MFWQTEKGGGVLGAGTVRKRGVLGAGTVRKRGGLRCGSNSKKGEGVLGAGQVQKGSPNRGTGHAPPPPPRGQGSGHNLEKKDLPHPLINMCIIRNLENICIYIYIGFVSNAQGALIETLNICALFRSHRFHSSGSAPNAHHVLCMINIALF